MPKPKPIWERWRENPKTAEKFYLVMFVGLILVNLFILIGIISFFIFAYY